jgi:hypothetical protein
VWRTLYKVGNIVMVVAIVLRCHLLIVKIRGRLAVFYVLLVNVFWGFEHL